MHTHNIDHHKEIWDPNVGDKFVALRELHNQFDKYAIKVLNGEVTVGHLPREYSRIAWYFLARGGSISVEVTFSCLRKATINRLKDLLTKKL